MGITFRGQKGGREKPGHIRDKRNKEERRRVYKYCNVFHPIKLSLINHWSTGKLLEELKDCSDREIAASEIIGRTIILYHTNDSEYVKIYNSFIELMKPPPNGFINVLYVSTNYDVKFGISSLVIKVPVTEVPPC